jgi:hypothetical protein
VEAHYRYYQFHSNTLVAMLFSYAAWRPTLGSRPVGSDIGIVFLSAIFFAVSRDNLRRYYGRAAVLLGTLNKEFPHEPKMKEPPGPFRAALSFSAHHGPAGWFIPEPIWNS